MKTRPARQRMQLTIAAALLAAGAAGCDTADPRIIATFSQGVTQNGFTPAMSGAIYSYNPPTLVGDHVYIGTSGRWNFEPASHNWFFKLDRHLKKVWEFGLGPNEVRGGAALDAQGRIYFVVEKGRRASDLEVATDFLYCLSNDGRFLWQFVIRGAGSWNGLGMFNPAIAEDGTIYIGGDRLYALDASGHLLWQYPAASEPILSIRNAPIIDPAGNVYFADWSTVYCLRPDGTLKWGYPAGSGGLSSPAFSVDRSRVYAAMGSTVHCLRAEDGWPIWSLTPPGMVGDFRATPAVDDADNVYVGTKADGDGAFYAIGADGTLLWKNEIGADLYSSPALGDDRTVYVGSEWVESQRRFHALDMATGRTKWSVRIPGGDVTWSSPALSDEGVLYVGSMDGIVYAIRSDAGRLLPGAGSPRFHGGNASTGRGE